MINLQFSKDMSAFSLSSFEGVVEDADPRFSRLLNKFLRSDGGRTNLMNFSSTLLLSNETRITG